MDLEVIGRHALLFDDDTTSAFVNSRRSCRSSALDLDLELQIFNSMSKKKEIFKPRVEGEVGMYVCGVTPYDFSHIGHARAYVAFDVLYR